MHKTATSMPPKASTRDWYALFLSILPVILVYKTPGLAVGLSTTLVAITLPPAFLVFLRRIKNIQFTLLWPFLLYLTYALFKSTLQDVMLCIAIGIHLCAISTGVINASSLRRFYEKISIIAAVCVVLQQLFHVLIGFHIPMIWTGGLIDSLKIYIHSILAGIPLGETMYRPCAFFLEPSHMSQYCIIGLGSVLFRTKPNFRRAALISLGMLLTTSGIGFVLTLTIWAWWWKINTKQKMTRNNIYVLFGALLIVLILLQTPIVHGTVSRIVANPDADYNAINGRLFFWETYFGDGQIGGYIWGKGTAELPEDFFTGIMTQLFAYGIIGTGLFVFFNIRLIKLSSGLPRFIAAVYLLLLVFSNLTGFIFMISILGTILALIQEKAT